MRLDTHNNIERICKQAIILELFQNLTANLVPVRATDADAKKKELSVAAIATKGTTARTSKMTARSLAKVSSKNMFLKSEPMGIVPYRNPTVYISILAARCHFKLCVLIQTYHFPF